MSFKHFTELHKETVRNVINPARRQISLGEMIHDADIRESLSTRKKVLVLSKATRASQGELEYIGSGYLLHCRASKLSISNNQSIVIVFGVGKREYFVQVRTKEVFADRISLAPINPRFYNRIGLNSMANLWFLEPNQIDQLAAGNYMVKRYELLYDEKRKINYFARDSVRGLSPGQDMLNFSQESVMSASIVDLSRGGCAFSVTKVADPAAAIGSVGFMETSVRWGKKQGNYSCFVVIKSAEFDAEGVRLRCSFLEPLTMLPTALADASKEYDLEASGAKELIINGRTHPADGSVRRKMPLGENLITVVWPDGRTQVQRLSLTEKTERTVNLLATDLVKTA